LFYKVHIPHSSHEFEHLLDVMDKTGAGLVCRDDFLAGVVQIAEGLRPVSVIEIHHKVAECISEIRDLKKSVSTCVAHLEDHSQPDDAYAKVVNSAASERNRNRDDASTVAGLQSLVLELSGEVQLIGSTVRAIADTQKIGVTECTCQLTCLRENVDKCLGYLDRKADAGIAGAVSCESSVAAMDGLIQEIRQDVGFPDHTSSPCIQRQLQDSNLPYLCSDNRTPLDTLEAVVCKALERDYAAGVRPEGLELAKLKADVQSFTLRLARDIKSLPTDFLLARDRVAGADADCPRHGFDRNLAVMLPSKRHPTSSHVEGVGSLDE